MGSFGKDEFAVAALKDARSNAFGAYLSGKVNLIMFNYIFNGNWRKPEIAWQ